MQHFNLDSLCLLPQIFRWHFSMEMAFSYEEDNHVQFSPELKVNQLNLCL